MRIFGPERMDAVAQKLWLPHGQAFTHPWISKSIETAQGKVEARNFASRKNVIKYDDVINDQRRLIFSQRKDFMMQESVAHIVDDLRHNAIEHFIETHCLETLYPEQWNISEAQEASFRLFHHTFPLDEWAKEEGITTDIMLERLADAADALYEQRRNKEDPKIWGAAEKQILLQTLDYLWREHIAALDHLKNVVGWRGYAQRDPLNEYKTEALQLFHALVHGLEIQVTRQLFLLEIIPAPVEDEDVSQFEMHRIDPLTGIDLEENQTSEHAHAYERVGRNAPCPCGSGKKYKHCHGAFSKVSV
jgi:preprotein translocase subunit SecA